MKKQTLTLIALGIGALGLAKAGAAGAAVIGFVPPSPLSVTNGTAVSVDVVVSDLGGGIVSAYDLDVSYDTSVLTANNVVFGLDLGDPFFFEVLETFDLSTPGIVDFAAVSLLSDAALAALQGPSVTLATLEFSAIQTGTTSLAFLFGPGQDVKGANNQVILPAAVPEPATWLLFVSGFVGMMLLASPRYRPSASLRPS